MRGLEQQAVVESGVEMDTTVFKNNLDEEGSPLHRGTAAHSSRASRASRATHVRSYYLSHPKYPPYIVDIDNEPLSPQY